MTRRPYIRPVRRYSWWLSQPRYVRYMLREVSAVFIGAYILVLIVGLLRLSQGPAAYESVIQPILRAGRITQQAVDAIRVLLVDGKLLGALQVLAEFNWPLLSGNDIGFNARQLLDEVFDRHDQVSLDWKVAERFDAYLFRVVADERVYGGKQE